MARPMTDARHAESTKSPEKSVLATGASDRTHARERSRENLANVGLRTLGRPVVLRHPAPLTIPAEFAVCPAAAELTSQSDFEAEEEEDDELAEVQDSFVLTTAQSLVSRRTLPIASGANLQEPTLEAERMVEAAFGQLEPEFATSAIRAGVFDYLRENGCMTPRALRVSFQLATNERYMRKCLVRAGAPETLACALKRVLNQ